MTDDQFGDPVNDEAWPIPPKREPRLSLLDVLRDWAQRVKVWLRGIEEDDE